MIDAMDKDRCLEILKGYGDIPWDLNLLCHYWARLTMVVREGGF